MKKKVLVDVKIICDEPRYLGRWYHTTEERIKALEGWVKEFHDFIRDHRSQDPVYLNIERVFKDRCGFCEREWEEDEKGLPVCCDRAIEEFMAYNIAVSKM